MGVPRSLTQPVDVCLILEHWTRSGIQQVLAVDRDADSVALGQAQLKTLSPSVGSLRCDLRQADLTQAIEWGDAPKHDAVFCHFAVHYFLDSEETTANFFTNLLPLLSPGGYFVATYMDGDMVAQQGSTEVGTDNGEACFRIRLVDEQKIEVFVGSIGRPHVENIVYEESLRKCFETVDLEHVETLEFSKLRSLFPELEAQLSTDEVSVSNLYRASVFRKRYIEKETPDDGFALLPHSVLPSILSFCDIADLGRLRGTNRFFRTFVDRASRSELLDGEREFKLFTYDDLNSVHEVHTQDHEFQVPLLPATIGTLLRLGGTVEQETREYYFPRYTYGGYDGYMS